MLDPRVNLSPPTHVTSDSCKGGVCSMSIMSSVFYLEIQAMDKSEKANLQRQISISVLKSELAFELWHCEEIHLQTTC